MKNWFSVNLAEADETDYDLYLCIFINEQGIINKLMEMVNSELHFSEEVSEQILNAIETDYPEFVLWENTIELKLNS